MSSGFEFSRRDLVTAACAIPAGCARGNDDVAAWPARWDRILVEKYVAAESERFDAAQSMVTRLLGPGYRYHTRLREMRVHPTRESLDYALGLLEAGGKDALDRARKVVDRVLELQDVDPTSKWYGIWGWYMEEPASKMAPADWNWADFNGGTLLLIEMRHGTKLSEALRDRVRDAIRHAAHSVMRRNVSMSYTNIAVKGTFVTLAASELLDDVELRSYASDRIVRLAQAIDESGSFAEYNSPTYARVSITDLTRIRMFVKDEQARRIALRIEERVWLHLSTRWDAPRLQLAGPMSRCYSTDLGSPAWLEKAMGGRLGLFGGKDPASMLPDDLEAGIHDFRCPPAIVPRFLAPETPRLHREVFANGRDGERPVQGSTYLAKAFSLGSVNRGDFWNQRRPVLAYWGDASRPAQNFTLRLVKDSYDFSSALLFTVQKDNCLLLLVDFRDPGGDRHISLDPIQNGEFTCGRLFLECDFEGLPPARSAGLSGNLTTIESSQIHAWLRVLGGAFGANKPRLKLTPASNSVVLTVDLLPEGGPHTVKWRETSEAWLAIAFALAPPEQQFREFAAACDRAPIVLRHTEGRVRMEWQSPAGILTLEGSTRVTTADAQVRMFFEEIGGRAVPAVRLSNAPLAG